MALNTEQKTLVEERVLEGERAAFASRGVQFEKCVFANGESPLKESRGIALSGCNFEWKYPLWYCDDVQVENCVWLEMARSGVWYTVCLSKRIVLRSSRSSEEQDQRWLLR